MKRGKLFLLGLLIFILVLVGYFQMGSEKISGEVEFKPRIADSFFQRSQFIICIILICIQFMNIQK